MKKCKLGELIEFQRGYDLPKTKAVLGKYKVITSNGIMTYHNEKKSGASIVIGRSGTIGKPQLIEEDFWPHNTTLFAKDLKGNDIKYLYYLLIHLNINKMKSGSNIPTLNRNHLHPLEIYAETDVNIQEKIANILFSFDCKIENNNKINNELEQLTKTIYDYWFLQFDFPDEKGKPYKSSGGKMVWNEELKREIPEGWEVKYLENIIVEKEKSKIQVNQVQSKNGKYPFFTSGDTILGWDNAFVDGKNCYLSTGGNANVKYFIGKSAYSTDTWCISATNNLENYLYLWLKSLGKNLHSKYFAGTGLKHLQKDLFRKTKIVIPNISVIEKFNKIAIVSYTKISENYLENEELKSLRDFLLPLLMNGQVNFKN